MLAGFLTRRRGRRPEAVEVEVQPLPEPPELLHPVRFLRGARGERIAGASPVMPTIASVYRPIEAHLETLCDGGRDRPLAPLDAYLIHRVLDFMPGTPTCTRTCLKPRSMILRAWSMTSGISAPSACA